VRRRQIWDGDGCGDRVQTGSGQGGERIEAQSRHNRDGAQTGSRQGQDRVETISRQDLESVRTEWRKSRNRVEIRRKAKAMKRLKGIIGKGLDRVETG
jgi:hypothetical protein